MAAFLTQAQMKRFEAEEQSLRLEMRHRATTAQLEGRGGAQVPTIVFGSRFARLWETADEKAFYGGRASGKSWHIAAYEVVRADNEHLKIACFRQFQNSIADSAKETIEGWI